MTTLSELASEFNSMAGSANTVLQRSVFIEAIAVRDAIAGKTPVRTGTLRRSWRVTQGTGTGIASASIINRISYAQYLEYGATDSNHPWVISVKQGKPKGVGTGPDGAVYSKKAMGGISPMVLTPGYRQKMARRIADTFMELIKK